MTRAVGVHMIGQTPRPDLEALLPSAPPDVEYRFRGALDGLAAASIPEPGPGAYPLETRLRDDTRITVGAAYLVPLLQRAIHDLDDDVEAHVLLCAGPFSGVTAERPIVRPSEAALAAVQHRGLHRLEIVVPFARQAPHVTARWEAAGHPNRTHVLGDKPADRAVSAWLAERCDGLWADGVVFDYVGFPPEIAEEVRSRLDLPVIDLGAAAVDALKTILDIP